MVLPPEERIQKKIRAYDQKAKKILSIKAILAFILQECVFEFQGMARKEIEKCIGKTQISKVPVDQNTPLVQGVESEHGNQSDAYIRYDLLLYATIPGTKKRIKLYINIEAQRTIPKAYPLLHRANVYVANGIAMQKGIEYTGSDYGKVKKCYSIWICMEAPDDTTAVNSYRFSENHIIGNHTAKISDYDLQTMVMIYLGKDHTASPMVNLLWALFKSAIPTQELEEKLEEDFDIRLTKPQAKELNTDGESRRGRIYSRAQRRPLGWPK